MRGGTKCAALAAPAGCVICVVFVLLCAAHEGECVSQSAGSPGRATCISLLRSGVTDELCSEKLLVFSDVDWTCCTGGRITLLKGMQANMLIYLRIIER